MFKHILLPIGGTAASQRALLLNQTQYGILSFNVPNRVPRVASPVCSRSNPGVAENVLRARLPK